MKTTMFQRKTTTTVATALVGLLTGLSSLQAGLVGFYSFDDPGNPLKDDSGNGNDLQGGMADPLYVAAGGVQAGGYVLRRHAAPGGAHQHQCVHHAQPHHGRMGQDIVARGREPESHGGTTTVATTGLSAWISETVGSVTTAFIGTGDPPPGSPGPKSTNDWTFVAVTYDDANGEMKVYVDVDSLSIGDALSVVTSPAAFGEGQETVAIGGLRPDNADEGWVGAVDNAFFYDEVLTLDRLTAIRNGGKGAILGSGGEDPDMRVTKRAAIA